MSKRYTRKVSGFGSAAAGGGGGGAVGGGTNGVFYLNDKNATEDYTLLADTNMGSFGPITIATGVTITLSTGSTWTIVGG